MSHSKASAHSGCVVVEVEAGDQEPARVRVADDVEDRVVRQERVAGEVHLRHEPLAEERPKREKWMCAGRHAFGWFRHGYAPGLTVVKR